MGMWQRRWRDMSEAYVPYALQMTTVSDPATLSAEHSIGV